MPVPGFDGNGNYVRQYSWVTDKTNGVPITSSRMDTEDNGFASGLSLAVTRDGQGRMTADLLPSATSVYSLGSASFKWANAWLSGTLNVAGATTLTTLSATALKSTANAVQGLGPVAGTFQDMTPDSGSFTVTLGGVSATTLNTVQWVRIGPIVILMPSIVGTSNANTFTATGLPAYLQPPTQSQFVQGMNFQDSGGSLLAGAIAIATGSGSLTFYLGKTNATGNDLQFLSNQWSVSGTKQVGGIFTYLLV